MNKPILALVVLLLLTIGCGGEGTGSPTQPSTSTPPPASGGGGMLVLVSAAAAGGSYSATLNGKTYTTAMGFTVSLNPGTYEFAGTYSASNFIVALATLSGSGGVQTGSVQSLAGPSLMVTPCGVAYVGGSTNQPFRLRFTVGTNSGNTCR